MRTSTSERYTPENCSRSGNRQLIEIMAMDAIASAIPTN